MRRSIGRFLWLIALATGCASAQSIISVGLDRRLAGLAETAKSIAPDETSFPSDLMRVAWLSLAGDRWPDALLILKPRKDECAVLASSRTPCRGLLLRGRGDGTFGLVTEFTLGVHPLVLRDTGSGVAELYHSRDMGTTVRYNGYSLGGERPSSLSNGPVDATAMNGWRASIIDDRSLPLWADQNYAVRNFDNRSARLGPFRLHFDGINVSSEHKSELIHDAAFDGRAAVLVDGLAPDLARVVAAIGWTQTLEARIWSCVDWMVPRRFWEVENRRLGKIGLCAEPLVFGLRQGTMKSTAEYLQVARYRLLQQVGIAFVLRQAPLTLGQRERLKSQEALAELIELGSAAGLAIGTSLKLQTPEQAVQSQATWRKLSELWFRDYEAGQRGYVIRSPELQWFDHELDLAETVLRCATTTRGDVCRKPTQERVELAKGWVRSALAP